MTQVTVDPREIAKFAKEAQAWWDPAGPYGPLHRLNPARLDFIRQRAIARFGAPASPRRPLNGLTALDVGCGGGLVAEPLARLGAAVTAIDAEGETLKVAAAHAEAQGLAISYRQAAAEDLAAEGAAFDLVTALEIVEHVADVDAFLGACAALVKPGGLIILSSINRTLRAYATAILGAERLLRWVPEGTHEFAKLVKPEEIEAALRAKGFAVDEPTGLEFDPLGRGFRLGPDVGVNYLIAAERPASARA